MNKPKYRGVRAPGTRNHGNGMLGAIYSGEGLTDFVADLAASSKDNVFSLPEKEKGFFLTASSSEEHAPSGRAAPSEEENIALAESHRKFSAPKLARREPKPYQLWEKSWFRRAAIDTPAVRHDRLAWLVGQMSHQVSRAMAEQIVKLQFDQRTVITNADWAEHRKEFLELWRGLMERWRATLSQPERDQLQLLMTEAERDTFRIVRSFHTLVSTRSEPDFPILQANLAARLGVSKQYAGQIVARLVDQGIIYRTVEPITRLRAAHYRWRLAPIAATPEPSGAQQSIPPSIATNATPALPQATASHPVPASIGDLPSPHLPADTPVETPKLPHAPNSCDQFAQGHTPPAPQKQSVEIRFLDHLSKVREVNFNLYRDANLRRGVAADDLEANIERLQRASDRLVALRLAYRLDTATVSLNTPKGALPLSNFHHQLLKNVIKYGTLDLQALQLAVCVGRGGPQHADLETAAGLFVAERLLTPDYRLNPDPDQPIS